MNPTSSTLLTRLTFGIRMFLFLLAPLLYLKMSPIHVALVIVTGILATWVVDYILCKTLWLPSKPVTLAISVSYLLAVVAIFVLKDRAFGGLIITLTTLTIALSSDAITNSGNWKLLLPLSLISLITFATCLITTTYRPEAATYVPVPVLAILARGIFPHTKHLIHTSLDYRFARVEILSLGMKRVAAIGIRRNKVASLP